MDFVSQKIAEVTPSVTLSITEQVGEMRSRGEEVFGFGAGEPDKDTPDHIKAAAIKALEEGKTRYAPSSGVKELRELLVAKFFDDNKIEYDFSQISVNCGAKHSCYNAILATCGPGDEVLIPAPYWTSYPEMVRMAGATPVIVETTAEDGWKLTAEAFENAMTPVTKMVILNSPNNPTGAVYSRAELTMLADVAASEDILVLSDEIYERLVYDGEEHISIASINEEIKNLTITINGFSKVFCMTGWRLGYTAAPPEIAKAISTIQSHSTSNATTFAQYGAIAALRGGYEWFEEMLEEFDVRRQYMVGRFKEIENVSFIEPKGAFYFLVDVSKTGLNSVNFADKLLQRQKVAVIPGAAFGADSTVRFSYATDFETISEGLDRFEEFCAQH